MSRATLPQQADVRKLAAKSSLFEGALSLADLPRVCEALPDSNGQLSYRLAFSVDDEGRMVIEGSIDAEVALPCQRCLQAMPWPVKSAFYLAVVASDDQADQLPDRFEPLVLSDGLVDGLTIIEDELLLSLPFVAYHQAEECGAEQGFVVQDEDYERAGKSRPNPFGVLAELKKD